MYMYANMCIYMYVYLVYTYNKQQTPAKARQHSNDTAPHFKTLLHTANAGGIRFEEQLAYSSRTTLQHPATHCNTMQHNAPHCNTLQHTAIHRNTLQHTAIHRNTVQQLQTREESALKNLLSTALARHCNTLQYSATHCNMMQHTAPHCNTMQHTAPHCNTLHHTAPHCNSPQHTATPANTGGIRFEESLVDSTCTTLQHTAI